MLPTLSSDLAVALERLVEFFRARTTRAGLLARRLLMMEMRNDGELGEHLVRERHRRTRIDGSIDGSLVATAWTAWELLQLDCPPDHAGVVRPVGFLLARQGQPGRFYGEGCTPDRHERKICSHSAGGFFSAAPEEHPVAPVTFPSGVTVEGEAEARFAASCFALRSVIRAAQDGRQGVRQHLVSLFDLGPLWSAWGGEWQPDLVFFALGPMALAPLDLRDRMGPAVAHVVRYQDPDGGWPGASPFHAVEMLLQVPTREGREAVARSAPLLCGLLQDPGTLEGDTGEERALIALRALKVAERGQP